MTDEAPLKKCFVIGPIGKAGSDTRNKADFLLECIIKPAVSQHGYKAYRADEVTDPGLVTDQVIIDTLESDLVIADLTSHNANAFYELGIRHTDSNKPTIHMILDGEEPPFDVKDNRYIPYKLDNPKDMDVAMKKLSEVVGSIKPDSEFHNPVTRARGLRALVNSEDSRDRIIAVLQKKIDRLERDVSHVKASNADNTSTETASDNINYLGIGNALKRISAARLADGNLGIADLKLSEALKQASNPQIKTLHDQLKDGMESDE